MKIISQKIRFFLTIFAILNFLFWYNAFQNFNAHLSTSSDFVSDFQKIGNGPHKLYVYSAYFNENNKVDGQVIILAGLKMYYQKPISCKFYSGDGYSETLTVTATLKKLPYDNLSPTSLPYVSYYIICSVFGQSPKFVSVFESTANDRNETRTNLLRIRYKTGYEQKYNFALCVQPIYNFDDPLRFAEFIEFYKLMGVEKFTFYNQSIGPETSCLMKSYGDLIEILPWTCPYVAEKEIRMYGQFIAANECLQRYKRISKYLVIVDLDEFIMPSPSIGNNYSEMIEFINTKSVNFSAEEISGYIFRNGFRSVKSHSVDSKVPIIAQSALVKNNNLQFHAGLIYKNLQISQSILRSTVLEPHGHRSKFILSPDRVVEVGNHVIAESITNTRSINVLENIAYSHHFRKCTSIKNLCDKRNKIVERSALRFAEEISLKIAIHVNGIVNRCPNISNIFL